MKTLEEAITLALDLLPYKTLRQNTRATVLPVYHVLTATLLSDSLIPVMVTHDLRDAVESELRRRYGDNA